jgi:hypothetical protein
LDFLDNVRRIDASAEPGVQAQLDHPVQERPVLRQELIACLGIAGLDLLQQPLRFPRVRFDRHGKPPIVLPPKRGKDGQLAEKN